MQVSCMASIKIPACSSFLLLLSIFSQLYSQSPTFCLHAILTILCPQPLKFGMVTWEVITSLIVLSSNLESFLKRYGPSLQWNTTQPNKKRWNAAIGDNMNGSWEYHAKWNKSGRKGQEAYDFTHMWNIKQKASNEQTKETNKPKKTNS